MVGLESSMDQAEAAKKPNNRKLMPLRKRGRKSFMNS